MNELTVTQLGTVVGLIYTLYQFTQAKSAQVAEIANLKARLYTLESQIQTHDDALIRIDTNLNKLVTAVARLEERLTALDAKLSTQPHQPHGINRPSAS